MRSWNGVRHREHSPVIGAETVPLTNTPSDTDSTRRSRSKSAPVATPAMSSPIRAGLATVSLQGKHRSRASPQPGDVDDERRTRT